MKKRPFTVDELFLPAPVENAGAEKLHSRLIDAYESAINQGIHPLDALAVILEWASTELKRVGVRPPRGPANGSGAQPNR